MFFVFSDLIFNNIYETYKLNNIIIGTIIIVNVNEFNITLLKTSSLKSKE
jgi:hypothetical protein